VAVVEHNGSRAEVVVDIVAEDAHAGPRATAPRQGGQVWFPLILP
jgi:hypothetical protein